MNVDFPYRIDGRGATALADDDRHIYDMIEQVLFTSPGERVNRPTFGSGLLQLVFAPNSVELAAAVQMQVHGALQQWLGDVIDVSEGDIESDDAALRVKGAYTIKRTQQERLAEFARAELGQ